MAKRSTRRMRGGFWAEFFEKLSSPFTAKNPVLPVTAGNATITAAESPPPQPKDIVINVKPPAREGATAPHDGLRGMLGTTSAAGGGRRRRRSTRRKARTVRRKARKASRKSRRASRKH